MRLKWRQNKPKKLFGGMLIGFGFAAGIGVFFIDVFVVGNAEGSALSLLAFLCIPMVLFGVNIIDNRYKEVKYEKGSRRYYGLDK